MKKATKRKKPSESAKAITRALVRAGKRARKTARMHGTSIVVSVNGKVVEKKP